MCWVYTLSVYQSTYPSILSIQWHILGDRIGPVHPGPMIFKTNLVVVCCRWSPEIQKIHSAHVPALIAYCTCVSFGGITWKVPCIRVLASNLHLALVQSKTYQCSFPMKGD